MGNYGLRVRRFYSIFLIMILLEIDFLGKQIVIYPTLDSFSLRVFPFLVLFSFFFTFPSTFGFFFRGRSYKVHHDFAHFERFCNA